ncbi:MAG: phosphate signaling complex protein PhoU [Thermoplasmata archaeon]
MAPTTERKALSEGLDHLNESMRQMAEQSQLAIRKATGYLEHGPTPGEADEVFTLDREIYDLREETVKSCVDLIALHAPVAKDLRVITTSLEITTDLDRIGRYAKDIVESALRIRIGSAPSPPKEEQLVRMGELTIEMVETAIRAFLTREASPVVNINQADDAVDNLHDRVFLDIVDRMAARELAPAEGAEYILINRYFERISDHAVSIGNQVVYLMTGRRPARGRRV